MSLALKADNFVILGTVLGISSFLIFRSRIELNPITRRRLKRFTAIKRGWYSFLFLCFLLFLAALGPVLVGNRALFVSYQGHWRFPVFEDPIPGDRFNLGYGYETNYRLLKEKFAEENTGDVVIMPPVKFDPKEFCEVNRPVEVRDGLVGIKGETGPLVEGRVFTLHPNGARKVEWSVRNGLPDGEMRRFNLRGEIVEKTEWENGVRRYRPHAAKHPGDDKPLTAMPKTELAALRTFIVNPTPPGLDGHIFGTDESGRDVLARLYGGFRIIIIASLIYMTFTYAIGIFIGCLMGYYGGAFDMLVQRFIEIWSNLPALYLIIFLASVVEPNLFWLMLIIVSTSWISMTYYMRTGVYREKNREYVNAVRLLGASDARIIFRHILPNTLSTIVTFVPFSIAAVTTMLTTLDFLGFGLNPTEPSWGDLLQQGKANFDSWWIFTSVTVCQVLLMMLVSFVGEAIRDAYDPKKYTTYA